MEGLIFVFFFVVIGIIVVMMAKNVAEWANNNRQPVLSAPARVVAKRSETSGNLTSNTGGMVSTWYYATFEMEEGERQEFQVPNRAYGMLAEGDKGTLRYQGTRYHGFERAHRG
jgi:hypothetical protein